MSMIHTLTVGIIDRAAIARREVVPLSELPDDVRALVQHHAARGSFSRQGDEGRFLVGGHPAIITSTILRLPWWSPGLNVPAVRLAVGALDLGCIVADVEHARVVPRSELERHVV